MRYLFGFLCVCALGVMPMAGCGENGGDDGRLCDGVVCPPDGNECTLEYCYYKAGTCESGRVADGKECDFDGLAGVCIQGVCAEYPCQDGVICDDGDLCTWDSCDYISGTCNFGPRCISSGCRVGWCDPADGSCSFTAAPDGTSCGDCHEVCINGACECPLPICFCVP
ncbi:MAG: hypothetical protein JRD92_12175 [Deltaproteobacteria bacterium]|nr:hypothetical protein [Deltaproteobacteria bacterium]MBW2160344.1 hypothetical protein [Deltaproteobacteria bacterium]MBW2380084.1 hypothetical protein [Deltaproteobacteria bacterium]MBW2587685.1 hypothetical protein [Deltaproteobacteria bacterium]MBW2686670.1 hypothetical protein [Deltaproteobacteria bacterium]